MSIVVHCTAVEDVWVKVADLSDVWGDGDVERVCKGARDAFKTFGIGRRKIRDLRVEGGGRGWGERGVVRGLGRSLDEHGEMGEYNIRHPTDGEVEDRVWVDVRRGGRGELWVSANGRGCGERGWRGGRDGKAPLKETVAAGLLEEAGFK
ncbi:hypothetical protein TrRE_jg814, partial [Triparma retinervis]